MHHTKKLFSREDDGGFDYDYGEEADEDAEVFWADDGGDEAEEEDGDDGEIHAVSEDCAAECDGVLAGYTEARQRLKVARAISHRPKARAREKARARARGRAALGAERCLRCGQAGHRAKACPAAGKRKAETDADINMVASCESGEPDSIQLAVEEHGTVPDDIAMEGRLRRYLEMLVSAGFDLSQVQVFQREKGFRFGNGEKNITSVCLFVPTFMEGLRRDILM